MGKIEITDHCLAPERFIYLKYKGKDPWGVAKHITDRIKPFFHISASGTSNYWFNWSRNPDSDSFYTLWWVKKAFSGWSYMQVNLKLQGKKMKADNTGEFTLQMDADLKTEVTGMSSLLMPFWYMYSYLFYNRVRRKWIDKCRDLVESFRNDIKEKFELETTSVGPAISSHG